MKQFSPFIVLGILIFHIVATIWAFYTMFSDYTIWTINHAYPFGLLLFTLAWTGIYLKKRWCAFAYFMLMFLEIAIKLFFGHNAFGEALGSILFPLDLVFSFSILILYKLHFGDRSAPQDNTFIKKA